MELNYEEQLQLGNSKEHLKVVLGNIRIANETLSTLYSEISKIKLETSEAGVVKERIIRENSEALFEITLRQSAQDRREDSLSIRESNIDEKEKDIQYKIDIANSKLEEINKQIAISESNYGELTADKGREIKTLEDKITELKNQIRTNEEENKEKLSIKKELENEITRLNSEVEEATKSFERFKINSNIELESIKLEQESEKDKIKNPLESIKREQLKLADKERALSIIKARLIKQFKQQNPNGLIPIDLQDNDK